MTQKKFKWVFDALGYIVVFIAVIIFASGIVLTGLGAFDFVKTFSHMDSHEGMVGLIAIGLLQAVDLFLLAIVFFVFSIGILVLFNSSTNNTTLPVWLQIKDFTALKVILWEAILTTLVISYIAGLFQRRLAGEQVATHHLIIPSAILILAISLFLLKKHGGSHD